MLGYTARRLLLMVPTLLLITVVVFAVVKLAPGNPFSVLQVPGEGPSRQMNPEDYQAMLHRYGLDRPWPVQYWRWLRTLASGSLGESFSQRRPVSDVLFGGAERAFSAGLPPAAAASSFLRRLAESPFGATVQLNLLALLLMVAVAFPVGLRAAVRRGSAFDRISSVLLYGLYSLPNFWVAVLLIVLVGVHWRLLPFIGMHSDGSGAMGPLAQAWDFLRHAALPALCLAYGGLAFVARFTRGTILETLNQDYVRTARAKGLTERAVLRRHAIRNALIPLLTLAGLLLPSLVSGSVIIEEIFAWPGLGRLFVQAIYARDYPVILAESVLGAVAVLLSTLAADLACAAADPRVRLT